MSYNYRKEYAKWKRWKEQEERILKQMNMPKNKINELREFDWAQFNDERRFTRKQNITNDQYFALIPVNDKKEFKNINDILDSIEDEALYEYLKDEEPVLLTVILLKIQGFSIKEISKVINIPISTIYRKIEKMPVSLLWKWVFFYEHKASPYLHIFNIGIFVICCYVVAIYML